MLIWHFGSIELKMSDSGSTVAEDSVIDDLNDADYVPPTGSETQTAKKARKQYKQNRPKVADEWSHEDILKLIKAVEERRTLWDMSSAEYKLPKTTAWQEVAEKIGTG